MSFLLSPSIGLRRSNTAVLGRRKTIRLINIAEWDGAGSVSDGFVDVESKRATLITFASKKIEDVNNAMRTSQNGSCISMMEVLAV